MAKASLSILIASTMLATSAAAQVTTYYGAEKVFMDKCSPAGTTANVQKACTCLMKSIIRNMTLQDFNSLEERAQMGQVSEMEIQQKQQLITKSRPALEECMAR
jgi:hypothetical protein